MGIISHVVLVAGARDRNTKDGRVLTPEYQQSPQLSFSNSISCNWKNGPFVGSETYLHYSYS
jgi:hypothetical protein